MSAGPSPIQVKGYARAASAQRLVGEILRDGVWPARDQAQDFLYQRIYHLLERGLIQDGPGMPNGPVF